jgi:hypothetical protein
MSREAGRVVAFRFGGCYNKSFTFCHLKLFVTLQILKKIFQALHQGCWNEIQGCPEVTLLNI